MKPPRILLLLPLLLMMAACHNKNEWKDDEIDPAIRSRIGQLNRQVIEGFAIQNPVKILQVCSKELTDKTTDDALYSLILSVGKRLHYDKFRIKNQFYIKNPEEGAVSNAGSGNKGDHNYTITFEALQKEAFVSIGYFEDSTQSLCLTTIYGKYGNEWKLNILQIGTLEIMRKDAVDWYGKAKKDFDQGYIADAANAMSVSAVALNPASRYWHYEKEQEINAFGDQIKAAARKAFTFPLTVTAVPSAPRIFQVGPEGTGAGFVPMVLYTTNLNMADTAALSRECNAIHSHIGELFKGLDRNNKWILYRAYEKKIPTGRDTVRNQGFVRSN